MVTSYCIMTNSRGRRVPKDWLIWPFEMNAENKKAAAIVAQVFNLLYRRFAIGKALKILIAIERTPAPQNGILRYTWLKTCATKGLPTRVIIDSVVSVGCIVQGVLQTGAF